jgi:predicted acylesterase/phospholipase RssA
MVAEQKHTALLLSAGAPHSPLMAGFLSAIYKKGKAFEFIYTSGAGALIGLLYVAPRDKTPDKALRGIVELAVADPIYQLCPINYKVFLKPGPFTRPMRALARHFKIPESSYRPIPEPLTPLGQLWGGWIETWIKSSNTNSRRRSYNDLVDFWAAVLTPTTLTPWSEGLCEPLPFLEEVVDFKKLHDFPGHFCLNAFNVTDDKMEVFSNEKITPAHVRAAFAHPFIYQPVRIGGKVYFEGADRDPICFGNLMEKMRDKVKTIVLLDILGSLADPLIREPRDLWDAYAMSILMPVIGLAKQEVEYFKNVLNKDPNGQDIFDLLSIPFEIPKELWPYITDWSYSNLENMWEIGHKTGEKFCDDNPDLLPNLA